MLTEHQAHDLADRIDADPRSQPAYDAHGLAYDDAGWFVCVIDMQSSPGHPSGRDLAVRSWDEWEAELATR
jgi:hypothetical protein